MTFSHFNPEGLPRMINVGHKDDTERVAIAHGCIQMKPETLLLIKNQNIKKGDVLAVAQVAGIMAAKQTSQMIPMAHNIMLTGVDVRFMLQTDTIVIESTVTTFGKTGAEMEALSVVSAAALTIYDMCKSVDKSMIIEQIMLMKKTGGKSGVYERPAM